MRRVAVLCVAPRSIYKRVSGVDAYCAGRDARTFAGGMPVVCHPPCRGWSLRCAHFAKPAPGEMDLGLWCCDVLRKEGGVLEQPSGSRLFAAGGLPEPGRSRGHLFSIEVCQWWWGLGARKSTWLCFSGVDPVDVQTPLRLFSPGRMQNIEYWSKAQRSETVPEFALWLVDLARGSRAGVVCQ